MEDVMTVPELPISAAAQPSPGEGGAQDVRARLDAAPMSRTQIIAIAITFLLSALDGYDVLSVTFAAPALTIAWGIGKAALGIVLAAGLGGMAVGAFALAPLADMVGRKPMILVALALMALGMLLCAFATSLEELALYRVIAGLGIGGCVAIINPIAAEFANARYRALTVSIMAIGYPVGGMVGGLGAALLLAHYDWRAVFLAGFVAALLLVPVVILALPESIAYLLTRRREGSLARLNAVLVRCGQPPLAALAESGAPRRRGYAAVFARDQIGATLWIMSVNLLLVQTIYFFLSWMPQMIADAGFPATRASLASAVANLAGAAGGLLLGWLARRHSLRGLVSGQLVLMGVMTALFGVTPPVFPLMLLVSGLCGFFLFGAASGMYAALATTFGDEARAAGTGFVSGMGRVSSAIAPAAAGWLFHAGLGTASVSLIFGAISLLAGALLFWGWKRFRPC